MIPTVASGSFFYRGLHGLDRRLRGYSGYKFWFNYMRLLHLKLHSAQRAAHSSQLLSVSRFTFDVCRC